jgi:hypothetical protein
VNGGVNALVKAGIMGLVLAVTAPLAFAQNASAPSPAAPGAQDGQTTSTTPEKPPTLILRGLDKMTGEATTIVAPIDKPVQFATLTIVARYCYSTPPSETPETAAFVQIEDHRPNQPARRIFSGWMYASSPGLNGLEHPLYDVWVVKCVGSSVPQVVAQSEAKDQAAPVRPPAADEGEALPDLPPDAGR